MHKATITQDIRGSPQCGATSTNSSLLYYLLSSFLQAQSIKTLLRRGQEICAHLARSSFPELGYNTKLLTVCTQSTTDDLHLALQVSTYTMHKASYNYLHLAQYLAPSITPIHRYLHRLDFYLYITKWA
jgi:hypothetical protein